MESLEDFSVSARTHLRKFWHLSLFAASFSSLNVFQWLQFLTLEHSRAYQALMSDNDRQHLPWLLEFRRLANQKPQKPFEGPLNDKAANAYYDQLIKKYIPGGQLRF